MNKDKRTPPQWDEVVIFGFLIAVLVVSCIVYNFLPSASGVNWFEILIGLSGGMLSFFLYKRIKETERTESRKQYKCLLIELAVIAICAVTFVVSGFCK